MKNVFAIIVNDNIIYVSRIEEEPRFEVIVFANTLSKLLGQQNWKLHKLILNPISTHEKERLLIHQVYHRNLDLDVIYCVSGKFSNGSKVGYEILQKFQYRIEKVFKPEVFLDAIKDKKEIFQNFCEEIAFYLEKNYNELIEQEENRHEVFIGDPGIVYSGISTQGLPIVSKLFNPAMIIGNRGDREKLNKRILFFENTISGQLATISINSFIRAKSYVEEIQFLLDEEEQKFGFINFAQIGVNKIYTLEFFSVGQPSISSEFFKSVKNTSDNFECLQNPFAGELTPYSKLRQFLSSLKFRENEN